MLTANFNLGAVCVFILPAEEKEAIPPADTSDKLQFS